MAKKSSDPKAQNVSKGAGAEKAAPGQAKPQGQEKPDMSPSEQGHGADAQTIGRGAVHFGGLFAASLSQLPSSTAIADEAPGSDGSGGAAPARIDDTGQSPQPDSMDFPMTAMAMAPRPKTSV